MYTIWVSPSGPTFSRVEPLKTSTCCLWQKQTGFRAKTGQRHGRLKFPGLTVQGLGVPHEMLHNTPKPLHSAMPGPKQRCLVRALWGPGTQARPRGLDDAVPSNLATPPPPPPVPKILNFFQEHIWEQKSFFKRQVGRWVKTHFLLIFVRKTVFAPQIVFSNKKNRSTIFFSKQL